MTGIWGKALELSIFGESHGPAIGISLHHLPAGLVLDQPAIERELARRAPGQSALTTARKESDQLEILSGVFEGITTGTPLTAIIYNNNTRSKDYHTLKRVMRPGQADYPGHIRYKGFNDYRGGGHFSGRITAPLVFAGAVCKQYLSQYDIRIGSHIQSIADIEDGSFAEQEEISPEVIQQLKNELLAVFDPTVRPLMAERIKQAKAESDSVGGVVETFALGVPAGIGSPFFDSVESSLAHLVFSIPATKGIEFGSGFKLAQLKGSEGNDCYYYDQNGQVKTQTNHNGGVLGGISYGMPIVFRTAIKAPASIGKKQKTIDIESGQAAELEIHGRHDPCIVPRVLPVLEAVTAIALMELMLRQGCEFNV